MCDSDEKKLVDSQKNRISPVEELIKPRKSIVGRLFAGAVGSFIMGAPFWLSMIVFSLGVFMGILHILDYSTYLIIDRYDELLRIFRKNKPLT